MKISFTQPKNILITGASSGLGAALAGHYAASGVSLFLQGRNAARLQEVAQICQNKGASVQLGVLDVTDSKALEQWILAADAENPMDIVIANAGISAGTGGKTEAASQVRALFATNIDGVINTIQPLVAKMTERGRGQIGIVSSLAGVRALPSCPAYSASKACVRYYGEALRGVLKPHGVGVSVICPGYIKTPMTDINPYPMPFLMSAEKAANIIARGLAKNAPRIAFPLPMYLPLWWLSCLPVRITNAFFDRLPAKPSVF
ncbi:MAG: SDR family NAD(P)-dependent oxidoreductase [Alphaproteobacteria bacterium]|nr:SDR family NAD(P)-dependent oxidoreductase [Alphaproteobacteria bacterium]